jgi:hypothetical protein
MTEIIRTLPLRKCPVCGGRGEIYQMLRPDYSAEILQPPGVHVDTIMGKVEIVLCPNCKGKREVPA